MRKLLVIGLILVFCSFVLAQDKELSPAEKYFSNTELINQNGEKMRLYQDILKNKVVIINVFHTSCTSTVPVMNRNLQKIQEAFPDNLGKDLLIASITVDSTNDNPEILK